MLLSRFADKMIPYDEELTEGEISDFFSIIWKAASLKYSLK